MTEMRPNSLNYRKTATIQGIDILAKYKLAAWPHDLSFFANDNKINWRNPAAPALSKPNR
jgi:hypothetical protein